jgi:hypothetical protein
MTAPRYFQKVPSVSAIQYDVSDNYLTYIIGSRDNNGGHVDLKSRNELFESVRSQVIFIQILLPNHDLSKANLFQFK